MDRFTWMVVGGVWVAIATGCSSESNTASYKSYKDLVAQDAAKSPPTETLKPTVETVPALTEEVPTVATENANVADVITPVSALAPVNVVDGTSSAAVLKVFPSPPGQANVVEATPATKTPDEPKPQGIQLLVPNREFKVEGPQNALRASYDDLDLLKVLNMEPVPEDAVKHFPSWLKALDGQRVRLRGFMYPTFQATGIDQFVLARDNQICCFGRNPKVYDLVSVQMRDGVTTDYIQNRPFDVVGTFRIDLIAEGGKPMGLYWLEDSVVINK